MQHYTAVTATGHTIILHGARELRDYQQQTSDDPSQARAERLIQITRGMDRREHRRLHDAGQCYGPCTL